MSDAIAAEPDARSAPPAHGAPASPTPDAPHVWRVTLAALGVVYGDIGTSPLYAMRECFHGAHGVPVSAANVLGVLSLILWSLVLVVAVKYMIFILRADNRGEGGILALMALILPKPGARGAGVILVLGLFGAAQLYGDGVITPAISVLSALEGLDVAAPMLAPAIIPLAVHVLHERVVLLRVESLPVPYALPSERLDVETLAINGIFRVTVRYGFTEKPNLPRVLREFVSRGLTIDQDEVSYVLGHETLLATERPGMALWREHLFSFLSRNAGDATAFFRLPAERVVEVGAQIEL